MTTSVSKVSKKVSKKKGSATSLHENSRDSQKLRRAAGRDDKLSKLAATRARLNQPYLQRVAYFQEVAKNASSPPSMAQIQESISSYLERDSTVLSTLQGSRRAGRPASNREDLLKQRIASEHKEHDSGYWIPDMTSEQNLEQLRIWSGEWASLNTLKFLRVTKDGVRHESSFPPKGQS